MNLHAVLFLSYFCFGNCAISLEQPPILAATVGSTVNLSCYLQLGGEEVKRIHLYWFSVGLEGTLEKTYLYPPSAMTSSTINRTSVRISNPRHPTDMSLSVSDLTLSHTDTYICHMSIVTASGSSSLTGNGTFLLVHEPLETSLSETDMICRTKVQTGTNVSLLWELENGTSGNSDLSWLANSDGSYGINSTLPSGTSLCQAPRNTTVTCLLQYKGGTVARKTMEVTCTGDPSDMNYPGHREAHQPALLYCLLLGSSLLILIVLLIIWFRNKWIHRSHTDRSPYTNISDLKRMHCL